MTPEPITLAESKHLVALEAIIEAGQKTFVEVGLALAEIRDSKLYRIEHATFEAYCKARWNFSRRYAYLVIESATAVKSLPAECEPVVHTERAARAVAKVEPERREEVVRKASAKAEGEGRKVTARDIEEADDADKPFEPAPVARPEPAVTVYYDRLEALVAEALIDGTDKQLVSMRVFAKTIPRLIDDALAKRRKKR